MSAIELFDTSRVGCNKNGEWVSLAYLKTMQSGHAWYEEHGYQISTESKVSRAIQKHELRNYSLSKLKDELTSWHGFKEFNPFYQEFKRQSHSDKFADFMTWIWDNHCDKFRFIQALSERHSGLRKYQFAYMYRFRKNLKLECSQRTKCFMNNP